LLVKITHADGALVGILPLVLVPLEAKIIVDAAEESLSLSQLFKRFLVLLVLMPDPTGIATSPIVRKKTNTIAGKTPKIRIISKFSSNMRLWFLPPHCKASALVRVTIL